MASASARPLSTWPSGGVHPGGSRRLPWAVTTRAGTRTVVYAQTRRPSARAPPDVPSRSHTGRSSTASSVLESHERTQRRWSQEIADFLPRHFGRRPVARRPSCPRKATLEVPLLPANRRRRRQATGRTKDSMPLSESSTPLLPARVPTRAACLLVRADTRTVFVQRAAPSSGRRSPVPFRLAAPSRRHRAASRRRSGRPMTSRHCNRPGGRLHATDSPAVDNQGIVYVDARPLVNAATRLAEVGLLGDA